MLPTSHLQLKSCSRRLELTTEATVRGKSPRPLFIAIMKNFMTNLNRDGTHIQVLYFKHYLVLNINHAEYDESSSSDAGSSDELLSHHCNLQVEVICFIHKLALQHTLTLYQKLHNVITFF